MHIQHLAIALGAVDRRRHDDEGVLGHEISDASCRSRIALVEGLDVEFQGGNEGQKERPATQALE